MSATAEAAELGKALRGEVIAQGDPGYDEARTVYNAMIDKRPALIARCADVADVVAAVDFGREQGLDVAVRGGGHNGAGLGLVDEGLVIDLSLMRGVRIETATIVLDRERLVIAREIERHHDAPRGGVLDRVGDRFLRDAVEVECDAGLARVRRPLGLKLAFEAV